MAGQTREIVAIPVDQIDATNRLRQVDPAFAQVLAGAFSVDGQHTPIEVARLPGRTGFVLVTGAHRLEAARILNWETIDAIIVGAGEQERRIREVSENLFRRGLSPLERADFVGELFELKRAAMAAGQTPQAVAGRVRNPKKDAKNEADAACARVARAYGWADDVADAVGLSRRSVYNDVLLYRGVSPAWRDALAGLPDGRQANLLRALAALMPEVQFRLLSGVREGRYASLKEALGSLKPKKAPETPRDRQRREVLDALSRAGSGERAAIFDEIVGRYLIEVKAALAKAEAA